MPQIEITDRDLTRLKKVAEPLVDTAATAFTKVMDFFEQHHASALAEKVASKGPGLREFPPDKLPPLVHTKLLMGRFANTAPDKSTWDSLARLALTTVFDRFGDVQSLRRISGANISDGKKEDEGYKPVRAYPFSYQGMSANDAARCIIRCARSLGCEAVFEFEWRQKDDAFAPGERARVSIKA